MNIAALLALVAKNPNLLGVLMNAPQIMAQFNTPKDGHKTTEFWLVGAINAFALLSPALSPEVGMIVAGALTGVYVLARALLKAAHALGKMTDEPDLPELPAETGLTQDAKKSMGL